MLPFSLSNFVKFLIGVVLVQGVTALLVATAYRTDLEKTFLLFLLLSLAIGALTAFWFTSMAEGTRKQSLSRAKEGFAREREKIRVRAEQAKAKEARNSQRQISREKQRVGKGGSVKTGLILGGAAGVGVAMLLAQFMTLGLLTLTTAGGAALGYRLRMRQERSGLGSAKLLPGSEKPVKVIEASHSKRAIEGRKAMPTSSGDG